MPPWTLSDPYHDFDGMEDELQAIVDKQGVGLTGDELTFVVLAVICPQEIMKNAAPIFRRLSTISARGRMLA